MKKGRDKYIGLLLQMMGEARTRGVSNTQWGAAIHAYFGVPLDKAMGYADKGAMTMIYRHAPGQVWQRTRDKDGVRTYYLKEYSPRGAELVEPASAKKKKKVRKLKVQPAKPSLSTVLVRIDQLRLEVEKILMAKV